MMKVYPFICGLSTEPEGYETTWGRTLCRVVNANWDMFEEEKAMCKCEALQRLFEPDIQAAAEAATKTATEQRLKQDISICIGRFRKMQIPRNDVVKIIAEKSCCSYESGSGTLKK